MARAFRLLNITSVSCGGPDDEGTGVTDVDNGGVLAAADATGDDPAPAGEEAGGDSSWANESVLIKRAGMTARRVLIRGGKHDNWRRR